MSHVAYIGNFGPEHSTENHVRQALEANGHQVRCLQEDDNDFTWEPHWMFDPSPDVVLWTRTASLSSLIPIERRIRMLELCASKGIPTIGYHLDRWWGLSREHEIHEDPFFRVSTLVTADGGHDQEWADAGVNHLWMPPAVSEFECVPGTYDEAYASDVAFVGSWQGYHEEWWSHRAQMLEHLRSWYGDRFRCWPVDGQPAVRGRPLRDLYASVKVIVGDSCLVPNSDGSPVERYWSDRLPETLGRGGILVHPHVEGMGFIGGIHLWFWKLDDLDSLREATDYALRMSDTERASMREMARRRILNGDTYTVRMRELWEHLGL